MSEWCINCPECYSPHDMHPPCGKVHDCPECAQAREEAAALDELDA